MTHRDDVWDEVLITLKNEGKFRIAELDALESESKRQTVLRVLNNMEEKGWLERTSPQSPIWRLGWKAKLILDIDEAVLERADS